MAKRGDPGLLEMVIGGILFAVVLAYVVSLFMKVQKEGFVSDITNSIEVYDNTKTYQPGALVNFQGTMYQMVEGAGQPGYAPDRPGDTLWSRLYDNTVAYKVGDKVMFKGAVYEMYEPVAAGNPPESPTDYYWAQPYDSKKVYGVGDKIAFNGKGYVMVEGAGQPGYAPDRPGDQLWKEAKPPPKAPPKPPVKAPPKRPVRPPPRKA